MAQNEKWTETETGTCGDCARNETNERCNICGRFLCERCAGRDRVGAERGARSSGS